MLFERLPASMVASTFGRAPSVSAVFRWGAIQGPEQLAGYVPGGRSSFDYAIVTIGCLWESKKVIAGGIEMSGPARTAEPSTRNRPSREEASGVAPTNCTSCVAVNPVQNSTTGCKLKRTSVELRTKRSTKHL